jgi:flagellar hook-length control protein FliK
MKEETVMPAPLPTVVPPALAVIAPPVQIAPPAPSIAAADPAIATPVGTEPATRPTGRHANSEPVKQLRIKADTAVTATLPQTDAAKPVAAPTFEINLQAPVAPSARAEAQPAPTPEATLAPRPLTIDNDRRWLEQLARDIETLATDGGRLRFVLTPERLGQLDVSIAKGPDSASIQLTASNEQAAQIIAAEQPRLLEELRQHGVRIASSDLSAGQQQHSRRDPQMTQPQGGQSQQQTAPDRSPTSHRPARDNARFA